MAQRTNTIGLFQHGLSKKYPGGKEHSAGRKQILTALPAITEEIIDHQRKKNSAVRTEK